MEFGNPGMRDTLTGIGRSFADELRERRRMAAQQEQQGIENRLRERLAASSEEDSARQRRIQELNIGSQFQQQGGADAARRALAHLRGPQQHQNQLQSPYGQQQMGTLQPQQQQQPDAADPRAQQAAYEETGMLQPTEIQEPNVDVWGAVQAEQNRQEQEAQREGLRGLRNQARELRVDIGDVMPLEQMTPQQVQEEQYRLQLGIAQATGADDQEEVVQKIQNEINRQEFQREYNQVRGAYGRILSATEPGVQSMSDTDDKTLMDNFLKMVTPEVRRVVDDGSLGDMGTLIERAAQGAKRWIKGQALDPKVRAALMQSSQRLYDFHRGEYETEFAPYAERIKQSRVDEAVAPGLRNSLAPELSEEDKEIMTWAYENPNDPRASEILRRIHNRGSQ